MRKISTLLTMLFLLCGVCMAQSSRVVYLKTVGRGAPDGRYMSCNANGGVGSIAAKDNSALWVLAPVSGKADTYTLRNANNGGYVKAFWSFEQQWQTVAAASEASELVMVDAGEGKVNFQRPDASSVDDGQYMNMHLAGDMNRMVIWTATEEASKWTIEDVSADINAVVLDNMQNYDKLSTALAEAEMNYANTLPSGFVKKGEGLVTSASQLYSNFPQNAADGGDVPNPAGWEDGQGLPALLDGNNNTFFHTRWGGTADKDYHTLQITLPEGSELKDFVAEFTTRNLRTVPSVIEVYGATKQGSELVWEESPYTTVNLDVNSMPKVDNNSRFVGSFEAGNGLTNYAALRLRVMATNTGDHSSGHPCFALSEFQLYAAEATVKPKYNAATYEDRMKLYNIIQQTRAELTDFDVTKDSYKALLTPLEETVTEVRDNIGGESLDLLLVIEEANEKLAALSQSANTPGQLSDENIKEWQAAIAAAVAVYDKYDKTNQVSRLNCNEARCQLEKFMEANKKSNIDVDADALTTGLFTIVNTRGAIVYDPSKNDKQDAAHHNNNYVWYAGANGFNELAATSLWGFFKNEENGELYLYNVGKGMFANPNGNGSYGDTWIFSKVPSPIKLEALDAPFVRIMGDGKTMSISTMYEGPVITYYAPGDGGVPFQFKRVAETTAISNLAAFQATLQAYVDRPKLVRPLRDRIDYLWDVLAEQRNHVGEVGHLNETALDALDYIVAEANEAANVIVITDEFEQSADTLASLNDAVAGIYYDVKSYVMPENGKYYVIKSDNSNDAHYHLAHFLAQNDAFELLAVPNSKGDTELTPWHCVLNEDDTFDFTNNNRYLAFGKTTAEPYGWIIDSPWRTYELEKNGFGWLSLYGAADDAYLAVNAETAATEGFVAERNFTFTPNVNEGAFYRNGQINDGSSYSSYWFSSDQPEFRLSTSKNNMHRSNGVIELMTGGSSCTYSVVAGDGLYQVGNILVSELVVDSFEVTVAVAAGKTTALVANETEYNLTEEDQTILVKGDKFEQKGANSNGLLVKGLKVYAHGFCTPTADLSTDFIFEEVEVDEAGNIAGGTTVGIDSIFGETAHDVYSLSGVLVRKQATNLNGLQKGIYVVNGRKVIVK